VSNGQKPGDKKPASASGPLFRKDDYLQPAHRPKEVATEAAPEVNQGAWRERAFVPRGVMSPEAIVAQLDQSLVLTAGKSLDGAASTMAKDWLPLLRQALEQAGGDGIDAWLLRALKPPGRNANTPFFDTLVADFAKVRAAADADAFLAAGRALIATVKAALDQKKRVSFKVLERELDGKLEVDELIAVRLATSAELEAREAEVSNTMENLAAQARALPGARPDGIYSNHARLKAELRVVKAERALRKPTP
jgi:hypothetical protein